MSEKEKQLAKYNLCKSLVELLGKEQATADLYRLYEHHKKDKMFKDIKEIDELIKEVVSKPDLIIKNPTPKTEKDYMVAKKHLDKEPHKMGDVGISNRDGENRIFHANKKAQRKFNRYEKIAANGGAVRSLHTPSPLSWKNGNDKSSGANALSLTANDIMPQTPNQNQAESKQKQIADMKERVKNAVNKGITTPQTPNKEMER